RVGILKICMSVMPARPMMLACLALLEGALKYGRHNWRKTGVRSSVYYDAMLRHLTAWWEGQDKASDSGVKHLAHLIACAVIVLDAEHIGKLIDDRPPRILDDWQAELNDEVKRLLAKYPDPAEPITQAMIEL